MWAYSRSVRLRLALEPQLGSQPVGHLLLRRQLADAARLPEFASPSSESWDGHQLPEYEG
jgi:hypothetical protein